eukprot:GHUV01043559.1.p1 GENE.GHUV01043559.1~~GHUV01043559.1.p1  ORF type:complete len:205 (+),score=41.92 GHUV01043559.1:994-1608(+)
MCILQVDILQHREEQIKLAEVRNNALQQQVERLQAEIGQCNEEFARLKEDNNKQAEKLDTASSLLSDKERLEETVRKQHDLIDQRGAEIKAARAQIEAKEQALDKARSHIEELSLKCQAATKLQVLFGEPWLVQTSRMKLKGTFPWDREYNILACSAGASLVCFIFCTWLVLDLESSPQHVWMCYTSACSAHVVDRAISIRLDN